MSNELAVIPENVPDYIKNRAGSGSVNDDAAAGISAGALPRLKAHMKQFTSIDADGAETPILPGHMIVAPDQNQYLGVVALGAKVAIQKTFYAGAYVPGEDGKAPDCFSEDGITPDQSVQVPMCESCATCPKNAWGSAVDQNGSAMKGKACRDSKVLALFVPKFGTRKFKLPPTSLKNFRTFVGELIKKGISITDIQLMLGFDPNAEGTVIVFRFGGFIKEKDLPAVAVMQASDEVSDIVSEKTQVALPAPTVQKTEPVAAPQAGAAKVENPVKKPVEVEVDTAVAAVAAVADLGLDLGTGLGEAEVVQETAAATTDADINDAFAEMGITL